MARSPSRWVVLPLLTLILLASCRQRPLPEPIRLTLPNAETGAPFDFESRRGRVVIVFFFSTWCIPCQAMEPYVARAAERGRLEEIDVVGVALDVDGRRTVTPYVWALRPPFTVVIGGGAVARGSSPFGKIPELPAVIILDREGRPASSISGVADTEFLLERARQVRSR